ncbi:MAG: hypothetical protein KDB16_20650, partial [Acidimicrobiales bacterium]|nr:hypothetical protein [Acidimicrobiales bacterium]
MSKHNHRVGRMAKNTWLAVLITAVVASTFAVLPVQPAAAQTSGLETIRAGSGDVAITQVVMTENGNTITQNSSVSGVIDADNDELKIESVTIVDGGQTVVLDEFNFTGIEVQNQNWGTNQSGVRTSENGVHTLPSHPDFW